MDPHEAFAADWRIVQLQTPEAFERYENGIAALLQMHRNVLMDDAMQDPKSLLVNAASAMPYLWVLTHSSNEVLAVGALCDIQPGRHAFIHGVSHPLLRRQPSLTGMALQLCRFAFERLQVLKVKAEFESDNRGAKGFCRRMGFVTEGRFAADIRIGGQLRDVTIASLTAEHFQERFAHGA